MNSREFSIENIRMQIIEEKYICTPGQDVKTPKCILLTEENAKSCIGGETGCFIKLELNLSEVKNIISLNLLQLLVKVEI